MDTAPIPYAPAQVIIACVGHIDHGKSSLVEALTAAGSTDRLADEQRRGMTIELGYAFASDGLEPACELAFIDCPGHERFVKRMIAGAFGSDGALLVVAADAGMEAQTLEHWEVLQLLNLPWGRVVLTRCDLADAEQLAATSSAIAEAVAGTPFADHPPLAVSSRRGDGIAELRSWLFGQARQRLQRPLDGPARLAIDRAFQLPGRGTIVTGTLSSGCIQRGDELVLCPGTGARVRGLQVHGRDVDQARPGQRVAINLARVEVAAVPRGTWITSPDAVMESRCIDVHLQPLERGIRHREVIELIHGTATLRGRCYLDAGVDLLTQPGPAQLRLEQPIFAAVGDALILRRPAPPANLGRADILDPAAKPRRRRQTAQARAARPEQALPAHLLQLAPAGMALDDLRRWAGGEGPAAAMLAELGPHKRQYGPYIWSEASWQQLRSCLLACILRVLEQEDGRVWVSLGELAHKIPAIPGKQWPLLMEGLASDEELQRWQQSLTAPLQIPTMGKRLRQAAEALMDSYQAAGLSPPYDHPMLAQQPDPSNAARALVWLRERGHLVALNDRQHLHRSILESAIAELLAACAAGQGITVQWVKAQWGLSRRWAIPLLEWCDRQRLTQRHGEQRRAGAQPHYDQPRFSLDF
ncbi:MAG: selenocysteine-specific translation elongation factor [Planctomycetota bacterium]|nr:MAG: selenocysteine-specific translation elongation factor [Planctomycetota bacterium]